jgi:hypothetical protein
LWQAAPVIDKSKPDVGTWRDQTQGNAMWQLTDDADVFAGRFKKPQKEKLATEKLQEKDVGNEAEFPLKDFLQEDLKMFFSAAGDQELFLTGLAKDGIVLA